MFYQKYKVLQNDSEYSYSSQFSVQIFRASSAIKSYLKKRLLTKNKKSNYFNIRNHRVFRFGYRTVMNLRLCVFSPKKDFHVHRL